MSLKNATPSSPQPSPTPSQPTPPPFQPTGAGEPITDSQPVLQPEPSQREQELEQQLAEVRQQLVKATAAPATPIEEAKAGFKVPKGEEHLTHAYVTKLNSVTLPTPTVQAFHPNVYRTLTKDPSFSATVFHAGK